MKPGDLVKWKTAAHYFGPYREAVGIVMKVHHYPDPDRRIIADILMDGKITSWNEINLVVISESR